MKWTIHELIRIYNQDNTFESDIDFSDWIEKTDIIRISNCHVEGDFEIYNNEEFVFYMDIKCTLILPCAITLEEVEYKIDISVEETLGTLKNEDFHIIEGITIDLLPIIWSNIVLEKPMRVLSENAYDNYTEESIELEADDEGNNAFSNLKNFKN
jgi:uncharacterized protein